MVRTYFLSKLRSIFFILICLILLYIFGVFHHPLEKDFYTDFHYPYDGDIENLILKLKHNQTTNVPVINSYNFYYYKSCDRKCQDITNLRLVYIIKSAPENFNRRTAIRSSWGFQRRFSDVEIRSVFLIGITNDAQVQTSINQESRKYSDIIQANYTDSYFNNTYKTMSGFEWGVKFCPRAKFYMFVDDDYYVSTKNVLRYIKFPTKYPEYLKEPFANIKALLGKRNILQDVDFGLDDDVRLYTGYAFHSAPHRHYVSKWYVPLNEYPYHMWPPYVSAGAYIVSNAALKDMYYASFYTKHFRFDDIYVGILAYKTKIEPFHSEKFHFYRKPYNKMEYEYVVASHGFGEPEELVRVWNEQKSLGHA